jgi:alkylation response protein AidB-like acyl-CoA dehydrogenase
MAWDFSTDPDYQEQLDWVDAFVREQVEPLDFVLPHHGFDHDDPVRQELVPPLQSEVMARGLWATHLGPELGGPGHGQVELGLLNEILGRSNCAPVVFGSQAPDSGNSEVLARYGSPELRARFLEPLLANRVGSAFSMTEPQGGSDPNVFETRAVRDGDSWVINGEKWFSTWARYAAFFIVMAVTDPDAEPRKRHSMFVVPADTPGIEFVRHVGRDWDAWNDGAEAYLRYHDVRVPADHLLGEMGEGFRVAQVRLGGGRVHHAMRAIGLARRMYELMCERAVSRYTQRETLARKQLVREMVADSWIELEQFRLLTLHTAWKIDQCGDYQQVRGDIAAVKATMQKVLHDVTARAIQVHGSLGITNEMPFVRTIVRSFELGLADGPTEVHKMTLAREQLARFEPAPGMFPTAHLPEQRARAREKYAEVLARHSR